MDPHSVQQRPKQGGQASWGRCSAEIDEKILKLVRLPKQEAIIEEIDIDEASDCRDENENNKPSITKKTRKTRHKIS